MVREFAFINFFRGVAAFWVLAAHCMIWGGWYGLPLPSAKIAVDLFMMISGYLMAANAFARNESEPLSEPRNWPIFWLRRFFRLAPAYYASLALAVVLGNRYLVGYHELQVLSPERWVNTVIYDPMRIDYSLTNVILHLSFVFGLHPTYSCSTFLPDWSLSLEMQFYLIFPVLLRFMQRTGYVRSAVLIGAPTIILAFSIAKVIHWYEPSLLIFKLQYFMAGILAFRFLSVYQTASIQEKLLTVIAAVFLVSLDFGYGSELIVLPLLLLSMVLLGWLEITNRTPTWLALITHSRITAFAADTSYGVYLFHGFFISASGFIISNNGVLLALSRPQRVLAIFVFVFALAYLTAFVTRRWIELPGIRLGKQFIQQVVPLGPVPPETHANTLLHGTLGGESANRPPVTAP